MVEARDGRLIGLEVKSSRSISAGDFRGLEYLREHAGDGFVAGLVLHSGPEVVPFGPRLWSAPLSLLWS